MAVHLLGRREAGLSGGVLSGGLRLVEGHSVGHVAVLLLHRLLGLVNIWTLLLLLLLGVGLGRSCHGISLSESVRLLGCLLLVWCVVLLHGVLRGLLVLLLWLLLLRHLLLLLLLRNAVLLVLLRLLLVYGRSLLLLLRHVVLRELLLRLSGALRGSLLLRASLLLLMLLLRRHLLLLLHGCAYLRCLNLLLRLLLGELRRRGRLLLLLFHFDVTLAHICLRLL